MKNEQRKGNEILDKKGLGAWNQGMGRKKRDEGKGGKTGQTHLDRKTKKK